MGRNSNSRRRGQWARLRPGRASCRSIEHPAGAFVGVGGQSVFVEELAHALIAVDLDRVGPGRAQHDRAVIGSVDQRHLFALAAEAVGDHPADGDLPVHSELDGVHASILPGFQASAARPERAGESAPLA